MIDEVKVPETTVDLREVECFLNTLELKIQSAVSRTNHITQLMDQVNDSTTQDLGEIQDNTLSVVSSQLQAQRTTALMTSDEHTVQVRFKNLFLYYHYGLDLMHAGILTLNLCSLS